MTTSVCKFVFGKMDQPIGNMVTEQKIKSSDTPNT